MRKHDSLQKKNTIKLISTLMLIATVIFLIQYFDLTQYINLASMRNLKARLEGFGILGLLVFVGLYAVAYFLLIPILPLAILSGLLFGPLMGTVWVSTGSILGAAAAFLVTRYVARDTVETWAEKSPQFKKIATGVEKHGWKILLLTRMVPIIPLSWQNFVYGLTKIKFSTYILISWLCIIPWAIAFTFIGGAFVANGAISLKNFAYLGISIVFILLFFLISGRLRKRVFKNE